MITESGAIIDAHSLRELKRLAPPTVGAGPKRILIAANHSVQFVAGFLPHYLATHGIDAMVEDIGFDRWEVGLLNPQDPLYQQDIDLILLWLSSSDTALAIANEPEQVAARLDTVVAGIQAHSRARIIVIGPERRHDACTAGSWSASWSADCLRHAQKALAPRGVEVLTLDALCAREPVVSYSERYYTVGKFAFHPDATPVLCAHLAARIARHLKPWLKLIVLDCDQTLWGGVSGELGAASVQLDPTGPGRSFLAFQRELRQLHQRGVLLALCSKNEEATVRAVFAQRQEMPLRWEHIVASAISWQPKSVAITELLAGLNLSTSGVVFLDDNPVERAEVKKLLPELCVPELPEVHADWLAHLDALGLWVPPLETEESRQRAAFYRTERDRQAERRQHGDYAAFLASLELRMWVHSAGDQLERCVELLARTNQFNLTTRRHDAAHIAALSEQGLAPCFELRDRYGQYGIIALALLAPRGSDLHIESWVMSCRVMSRTVEQAIIVQLAALARRHQCTRLLGEFLPTAKNAAVRDLYAGLGFTALDAAAAPAAGSWWVRPVATGPWPETAVQVVRDEEERL